MILESISVKNFRSIREEILRCDDLTAIVGANGVGKSAFLRALELFYTPNARVTRDDFYAGDSGAELIIHLRFSNLVQSASTRFNAYVRNNALDIERVFTLQDDRLQSAYFGTKLRHQPFQTVRNGLLARDRGKTAREAYDGLRASDPYSSLPEWTVLGAVQPALEGWETGHPDLCNPSRDDGEFFGFSNASHGYLGRYTKLLYIPAVRDAARDAEEGRGSVLTGLMDLLVRQAVAKRPRFIRLLRRTQALYRRALDPDGIGELKELAQNLTATLTGLVPDTVVELGWKPLDDIEMPLPSAEVKLVEDGYSSSVERTGHGLQRAFIITILQHLAMAEVTDDNPAAQQADVEKPNLVLAIEEPELYQHPARQRHFARTLLQLAIGAAPGVADRTQVVYGTHSPIFVSIDRIHQVRLLRRRLVEPQRPKVTRVFSTSLDAIAQGLWLANGQVGPPFTPVTLLPRLRSVITPSMSEGFFADVVVLVEGEDDRAALLGVAQSMGHDFETGGITVIGCGGKTSMDRPFLVFSGLEIPVYVVWDNDRGGQNADPEDNHRLLRLVGAPVSDWPVGVFDRHACFDHDLETTLRQELTQPVYDGLLTQCQTEFAIPKKKHAQKNAHVVERLISRAHETGHHCLTLEGIVERVRALM